VMPVIYRCKNCGHVLYVFRSVGQDYYGVPTPTELFARLGMICPKCGRRLEKPSIDDIRVRPA